MGGAMGWTPGEVRAVSLSDFAASLEGWQRAQGLDPDNPRKGPMTRAELDALRAQFPD